MNKKSLETICFKIIEWGIYLALLTPLIFSSDYFFPFSGPKTFFFRIVVSFILTAYILLAVLNSRYRPRITPLTLGLSVFLAVLTLTSATGLNLEKSFFGLFQRGGGLLSFFYLFAFYIVLTGFFKDKKQWERLLIFSIMICVFVCLSVLFLDSSFDRGGGTIGNSSFFSAYLLFNLFFSLILLVTKTGLRRVFYGLAFTLFIFFLFSNPGAFTKGAVAAFFFGIIVLIFSCLFYSDKKRMISFLFLILMLSALSLVLFSQIDFAREKAFEFWQSNSVQSRVTVWQIGRQGWQERFWLGWGPENFNIPFARHFDPQLALSDDKWFDRAHNIVLDIGVASGIFGVLSYLAVFCLAFSGLIKRLLLKDIKEKEAVTCFIMIALLAAYFFQNLWVFDTISSYLMFFLSLAFINFLVYPQREEFNKKTGFLGVSIAAALILLTLVSFYFGVIQPSRASKLIGKAHTQTPEEFIPAFQKAFDVFPLAGVEGSVYLSSGMKGWAEKENQDKELIYRGFSLAEEQLKKAILENPLDCWLYLSLGEHYNNFYEFSSDRGKLTSAQVSLEKALELAPNFQQTYFVFSQTRFLQEEPAKALELLKKAKDLEPRYKKAIWYLAEGYMRAGEQESALSELKLLEDMDLTCKDAEYLAEVRKVFKEAGKDSDVFFPLYKKGFELNPERICFRFDLIGAYLERGEKEKVREILEGRFTP